MKNFADFCHCWDDCHSNLWLTFATFKSMMVLHLNGKIGVTILALYQPIGCLQSSIRPNFPTLSFMWNTDIECMYSGFSTSDALIQKDGIVLQIRQGVLFNHPYLWISASIICKVSMTFLCVYMIVLQSLNYVQCTDWMPMIYVMHGLPSTWGKMKWPWVRWIVLKLRYKKFEVLRCQKMSFYVFSILP